MNYIGYARKSSESEDRQILSIESQITELHRSAEKYNIPIANVKVLFEAKSAKIPGREVFNKMIDLIEDGKAQGIICWHPDRLSRNSVDTGRLIYLFDQNKLQELVTPSQTFRNTPNDKFLLSLLCSQAKLDNDNKSINVKRGLRTKCEKGIFPSMSPIGYFNDKNTKTHLPDPERFDLTKRIFQLILTDHKTPMQLFKIVNDEWKFKQRNGHEIARSTIYKMLSNPFYYGSFEYPVGSGKMYKGIHQPMITEDDFWLIQEYLGRKGKAKPKIKHFAYTGLITCGECGGVVTCEEKYKHQKNGKVHHYIFYHCTKRVHPNCVQGSVEETKLNGQIDNIVKSIRIPTSFHEWGMKWFRTQNEKEGGYTQKIVDNQQKEYKSVLSKLNNLLDMRTANEIGPEEYQNKKKELEVQKAKCEELFNDTAHRVDRWVEEAEKLFDFAEKASLVFMNGDLEIKRDIFAHLGSNLVLKDRIIVANLENTLIPMQIVSQESQKIIKSLEPAKESENYDKLSKLYSENPLVFPRMDSNHNHDVQSVVSYH